MRTLFLILALSAAASAASKNLDIYWIDVDGGAATLIVAPSGETLLVDTGFPGNGDRDPKRILAAAKLAGLTRIDTLITTHFHIDHIGGLPALQAQIPIGAYLDHGESVEIDRPTIAPVYKAYTDIAGSKRRIVKPGDRIAMKDVEIEVVTAGGEAIAKPIKGASGGKAGCAGFQKHPDDIDPDNDMSVGILLKFGKFDFLDLGDLTWNYEQKLLCPEAKIGKVDLLQISHHGSDRSNSPQLLAMLQPTAAVMNNGSRKGGSESVFANLRKAGITELWQGHLTLAVPRELNSVDDMIANLEPTGQCKGEMLKASVEPNGRFTVTNLRNGFSKSYQSR
jgi:beta-lactamase superfamily II metal-dependent hydrolase